MVLRLEKKGSIYSAWYSTGKGDFELLGSTEVVLSDIKAGLITCEGEEASGGDRIAQMMGIGSTDADKPFKVMFDYFNIMNAGN
jgi:hypothetical protein